MYQMNNYELDRMISNRFNFGMESDQDIEINAEEVIINADNTVDDEIETLAEASSEVTETSANLEKVAEAEATLESLILSMEASILRGGFDSQNAEIANIALESIATRFDIDASFLTFGLEEVTADGEEETKSTIGKAKEMLGALKSNAGALLAKLYASVLAAMNETTALSEKLISHAAQLKSKINQGNKGGNNVNLKKGVVKKLTLDGKTALDPNKFVGELKRLTNSYVKVVDTYSRGDVLSKFVKDTVANMNGSEEAPASTKEIKAAIRSISETMNVKGGEKDGAEIKHSEPFLGGGYFVSRRPSQTTVKELINSLTSKKTVSQEAAIPEILNQRFKPTHWGKYLLGGAMFGMGISVLLNAVKKALALKAFATTVGSAAGAVLHAGGVVPSATAATAAATGIAAVIGVVGVGILSLIAYYGIKRGFKMMKDNADIVPIFKTDTTDAITTQVNESVELATEFEVVNVSLEGTDEQAGVKSLNAKQINEVLNIITATSGITATMKKEVAKRKALMKEINQIVKTISVDNKESGSGNTAIVKMTADFIKRFIEQTIKFEMEVTKYCLSVMKASLAYAERSNTQEEVSTESFEKKS